MKRTPELNDDAPLLTLAGELQQYSRQVESLSNSVGKIETNLASARESAAVAASTLERSEDDLVAGKISREAQSSLVKRQADLEARILTLHNELRIERRLLFKAEEALTTVQAAYQVDRRSNARRQCAEIIAPVIDAIVEAVTRASAVDGIGQYLESWAQGFQNSDNRSTNTRFACINLAIMMRQLLSGGGDATFLADVIGDLRAGAPELVTYGMENFLAQRARQLNERFAAKEAEGKRARARHAAGHPLSTLQSFSEPFGIAGDAGPAPPQPSLPPGTMWNGFKK